ncbi:MAG: DUF5011 domain-containing protein, partial [Clostridia bacterium]|nr:DUF5011 domain-containing protein [Clostridia bacterium]
DKNIDTIKIYDYTTNKTIDFISGTDMIDDGHYRITATDIAGNKKIVYFKIDKTAPEVKGITDGAIVKASVTLTITDTNLKSSKLNNVDYTSGTEIIAEGKYQLVSKDTAGNETIINFVIDKTAPQGRLKGLSNISLKVAEKYNEPGIEITDNIMEESEIASRVIRSYTFKAIGSTTYANVNSVDTSKAGQYYVYYNATDLAGNEMGKISRGVLIVDEVAPVGNLIGLESINVKQGTIYQDQGITVTDNEDINISEKIVIDYTFKAKGTDSYVEVDKIDTSKLGTYYIYYNAKDRSGNEMSTISRVIEVKESLKIVKSGVGSNIIVGDAGTTVNNFNSFAVTFNKDIVAKTNNDFRIGYKYRINGEGTWETHPFINNWNGSLRTVDEGFWLYNESTKRFVAGTIPANSIIRNSGTQAKVGGQMVDTYTLIKDTKNSGNTINVKTILYVKDNDFGTVETFELEEVKYWYDTAKNVYQATPRGLPEIK